jgi:gliding motility-associated-like protein
MISKSALFEIQAIYLNITKRSSSFLKVLLSSLCLIFCLQSAFAQAPTITTFTPLSGVVGTSVTISGTNFNTVMANNIVFFGASKATVTAASATSLTVTVPTGATFGPIFVLNNGTNLSTQSAQLFNPRFNPFRNKITTSDFSAKVDITAGQVAYHIAAGDLDGDGKVDLLTTTDIGASFQRNTSTVGNVSFDASTDLGTGTGKSEGVALGDIDGDGKLDVAITNYGNTTVSIFLNTSTSGNISFAAKADFIVGNGPYGVAISDLDADGKPDLAVTNYDDNTVSILKSTGSLGNISFDPKVDYVTGNGPTGIKISDIDGDGKPELVIADWLFDDVSILRNTSAGSISFDPKVDYGLGDGTKSVAIGDLNGDQKPEIIVASFDAGVIAVLQNNSTPGGFVPGSFSDYVNLAIPGKSSSVVISDFNGDEHLDLLTTNRQDSKISIVRNKGLTGAIDANSFDGQIEFNAGNIPMFAAIADIDGDGKLDIAQIGNDNFISVFLSSPQSNADLFNLTSTAGTLDPIFDSATTAYTVDVSGGTTSVTVTPTVDFSASTIEVRVNGGAYAAVTSAAASSALNLTVGANPIDVKVTAQDGTTIKTYTITVTRAASTNADLSALSSTAGAIAPAFAAATTAYTASVTNATTSVTVTPTIADATATIEVRVNGGAYAAVTSAAASSALNLTVGANPIDVKVTAQDGTTIKTYTITVTRAASTNADLSALSSTAGAIAPAFAAATTAYTASVTNATTSVTVTPTIADATATIEVRVNGGVYAAVTSAAASSALNLAVGANPIDVKVTAQDGTTIKTYTITVTRAASTNADLSALSSTAGAIAPAFAAATTAYTASVTNATTSVTVTPTIADATATIEVRVNGGAYAAVTSAAASSALNLTVGANPIDVKVTAQDGTTIKTYTITVTRAASTNADLSALSSTAGAIAPAFAAATTAYTASVTNATTSVTVTPTIADATATIEVRVNGGAYAAVTSAAASSALNLAVGANPIDVKVTAQDGTTIKTYTITVTRAASTNADLSALSSTAGAIAPAFAAATTAYTASVTNATTSVTVTPTLADATATIEVRVNGGAYAAVTSAAASSALNLTVGANPIDVKVTAQDGTTIKTYTITVTRAASTNADLSALSSTAGAIAPAFAAATTAYTASVTNATTSVTVTPTIADATATIEVRVNGGAYAAVTSAAASSALNLAVGANPIDVKVTAQDGITIKTYTITVTRAAASTNADLSALSSTAGAIAPAFAAATTAYTASVTNATTSVTVTPTIADATATIEVRVNGGAYAAVTSAAASSALNLAVGANPIDVKVTAQDGTTIKTYTITVTRAASTNADLSALSSTAGAIAPAFAAATTAYTASVTNATTSVTVTPTIADATATIEVRVNGGAYAAVTSAAASSALNLTVGANPIDVKVTAQDGTTIKTYTITVTRAASTNADLSALSSTAGAIAPAFAAATTAYTASVTNATTSVTVTPTLADATATIEVRVNGGAYAAVTSAAASSALNLTVGANPIDVKVTAQDGTTIKTYTITVTRAASTNADLSALSSTAGAIAPAFAAATTAYTASVTNATTSVTVTPTLADATATIEVRVNGGAYAAVTSAAASSALNLTVGANPIDVKVTAQDGTTIKTYTITVTRAASTNADLSALSSTAGAIAPAFAAATTAYTASVTNATTSVTVTPTIADATATIEVRVNGGAYAAVTSAAASSALNLAVGANPIDVKVTAQDGTTIKTYTITVTRAASTNADLSALSSTAGAIAPAFAAATTAYTASVTNATTSVTVTPTIADATATIEVRVNGGAYAAVTSAAASSALNLTVGANPIDVKVTAQDGTTIKTYTITVTRAASTNADLSALSSTAGAIAPAFAAATTAYTASVTNATTSVTVTPTIADATATIEVRVNGGAYAAVTSAAASSALNLAVGANPIDVKVTAQDGTTIKTYTITVTRVAGAILQTDQIISFNILAPKSYGAADFDPAASASSGLTISYSSSNPAVATIISGKIHITGAGSTLITASQGGSVLYNAAPTVTQAFNVDKSTLTITADDKSRLERSDNPTLTYTYTGFVYSEDSSVLASQPLINTSAGISSVPGSYPIVISGGSAANYNFNYINGTLTILPTINSAPTLSTIANQVICYTAAAQSIALSGITAGSETGQTTTLSISSSNSTLLSALSITTSNNGTGVITFTPINPAGGIATITVTVKDNGGTSNGGIDTFSRIFTITINPIPLSAISSDQGLDISRGSTVNLTASGGTSYSWATALGIINGQNTAVLTVRPLQNTTYTVTVRNSSGCSTVQTISLNVIDDFTAVKIAGLMSPNGDGVNDTWIIKNIDAFPNNEVKVFDGVGRVVFQRKGYNNGSGWDGSLNGVALAEGYYFYIIDFGDGKGQLRGSITILANR